MRVLGFLMFAHVAVGQDRRAPCPRVPRFVREEDGNVLLLTALFICFVLLGVSALAIDSGWVYHEETVVQSAADDAALAAATAESESGSPTLSAAKTAATGNGLTVVTGTPAAGQASVSVVQDGITGPTSSIKYIQVRITDVVPTFFLGAFRSGLAAIPVTAKALASYKVAPAGGGPCLNTNSLTINSGTSGAPSGAVNAPGAHCGVNDNASSGFNANSNVTLNVSYFTYHGSSYNNNCGNCSTFNPLPSANSPTIPDPFSSLSPPAAPAISSTNSGVVASATTLQPGTYTQNLSFNSCGGSCSYTVNLQPGLYYFSGGLNIDTNVTIQGTGVTMFFPRACY